MSKSKYTPAGRSLINLQITAPDLNTYPAYMAQWSGCKDLNFGFIAALQRELIIIRLYKANALQFAGTKDFWYRVPHIWLADSLFCYSGSAEYLDQCLCQEIDLWISQLEQGTSTSLPRLKECVHIMCREGGG